MLNFTLEKQIKPNKEIIELLNKTSYKANKKSSELKQNSEDIKEKIDKLKVSN